MEGQPHRRPGRDHQWPVRVGWSSVAHGVQDACRSYTMATVYAATPKTEGGYSFSQSNQWVFTNIVMFGGPAKR